MFFKADTVVTYITVDDLTHEAKKKSIDNVRVFDVKDRDIICRAELLILKKNGEYKVLKSIY